jgi:hypothetical protein
MGRVSRALLAACLVTVASQARADDEVTQQAREAFVRGTEFVHHAQWAEALVAFEQSAKLKPHAVATYNIAACERALGRYTRARQALRDALAQNDAAQKSQLAESLVTEANAQLAQIDGLLATADVTLDPPSASVAIDGRPLAQGPDGTLVAGMRLPGPGEPPPAARFKIVMDPGVHILTLSRKGYTDAVVNKTFSPGTTTAVALALDKLPSIFHVEADQASAVVTFGGHDVGVVPVDVSRPSGAYRVQVNKAGYLAYEATVTGAPGELVNLRAKLAVSKPSIFTRWWFWTIAGVVVAGAATATYFLVRQPPPPNGGGLGWSVPIPP